MQLFPYLQASSVASLYGHFLPFKSQHEINVIIITYLTVICLDPITPHVFAWKSRDFNRLFTLKDNAIECVRADLKKNSSPSCPSLSST